MRFGTYFFLQAAPGRRHADIIRHELDQMVLSEELGFDEVWLTEHHFIDYGLSVDPATLASAVASRTSKVRIGLAAAILPFHDPIRIAEQLALVDIISGGRLDVGVGRGNRPSEFIGYRVPQVESRERFDEVVQIIQRAWTDERFSYDGRYFQIPEVRVIPKPLQRPHPPLYQVCVSPDSIEGTALRGWPMRMPRMIQSPRTSHSQAEKCPGMAGMSFIRMKEKPTSAPINAMTLLRRRCG